MDESTTDAVRMARLRESTWTQPFVFPVGKTKIDLSVVVGTKAITPTSATNQPKMYPVVSRYLFDPSIYTGLGALEQLKSDLKAACPGCVLYPICGEGKVYTTYTFRCSHYYVQENVKQFSPGSFTQQGVRPETNKVRTNDPSFDRMMNRKLKTGKVRKPSTDHRGGKQRTKECVDSPSRRTHGSRAQSTETRCKMNLKVHHFHASQQWYLSKRG